MRTLCLLLLLLAGSVLAQPASAGVALRKGDLYTTGVVTLYVDPAGNDAKLCQGTGTAACKTLAGALAKLPPNLKHNVTINVAAGTYTLTSTTAIDGFWMAEGVSLTIQGSTSYTTFTPPSGNAGGTVTSFAAQVFPTSRATITDSGQSLPAAPTGSAGSMTANQLAMRGRFICFTSGPQSGNRFVVMGTGGTTIELNKTSFTGGNPAAGNTYSLCTPSTVFTGGLGSSGALLRVGNNIGTININDIAVEPTVGNTFTQGIFLGGAAGSRVGVATSVLLNRVRGRVQSNSAAGPTVLQVRGMWTVQATDTAWIAATQTEGGNDSTAVGINAANGPFGGARVLLSNSYLRAQRGVVSVNNATGQFSSVVIDSDNITPNGVVAAFSANINTVTGTWINCYSYQVSGVHSSNSGLSLSLGTRANIFQLAVDGCFVGLDLGFGGTAAKSPGAIHNVAYASASAVLRFTNIGQASPTTGAAVMLGTGSVVNFAGATVTLTTVADGNRDYVCPNTTTGYTEAAVQAAPDKFFTCQGASFQR